MERGLLGALGIGIALFGALFFFYFSTELATGGDGKTRPGVLVGLIVFFGGMLATGLYLAWRMFRTRPASPPTTGAARPGSSTGGSQGGSAPPSPPRTDAERERRVLHLAQREHGRVTIPEVASRCDMTIAESKATLDGLVLNHVAEIQVTPGGVLVYVFAGFLSDSDKASATDF
jgi:hypothetical protein